MLVTIHQHTVKGTSIEAGLDVGMVFAGESVPDRLEPEFGTHRIEVPDPWRLIGPEGDWGDTWLWHPEHGYVEAWDAFLAATWGDHGFRILGAGDVAEATPCG
jgi:hypothetical protein